jgi:SAM-dependent methyltransferase
VACAWCSAPLGPAGRPAPGGLRCPVCGVTTTSPWPSDAELDAAYSEAYRPSAGKRFGGPLDAVLARTRGKLARRIDAVAPAGPVLDVGAGDGTLVAAIRATGREAVGLERGASGGGALRDSSATDLLRDEDTRYAAVVFWHVLEHLRDPEAQLAAAAQLLVPGGVLVIAVPNAGSLQARLFGERWLALDPPRHLTHITRDALHTRLRDLGLTITRTSELRGGQVLFGWLHGLVAQLGRRDSYPDLYDAIRAPAAQQGRPLTGARRVAVLAAGAAALPLAAVGVAVEVTARRSGTLYVEARR